MKVRIVVTNDGQVSLFSEDGTFSEGKEKLELMLKYFQAQGIELSDIGQVEQHRHDGDGVLAGHVHSH